MTRTLFAVAIVGLVYAATPATAEATLLLPHGDQHRKPGLSYGRPVAPLLARQPWTNPLPHLLAR